MESRKITKLMLNDENEFKVGRNDVARINMVLVMEKELGFELVLDTGNVVMIPYARAAAWFMEPEN